jgi:transcriptional regulator GlxA family with amidase domain
MRSLRAALSGFSIAAIALSACGGDIQVSPAQTDPAATAEQARDFVEALAPRHPGRPVVVVLARNEGTETTDFLLTHAVLQRAGVADVQAVAPRLGRVSLYPTLEVEVRQDLAGFDKTHPSGADYVIVPALDDTDDPAITGWLKQQAKRGARILGVCAGALIVGRAGLLDHRRFTTHWYFRSTVLERHPSAQYVPHQRYVVDRDVATTTGITASVPAMLALVEAIGGRDKAQTLADELGVKTWSPAHDSSRFGLSASLKLNYVLTQIAFWNHERWSVDVRNGMDDIALALAADAWSRTGRVRVEAAAPGPVTLRSGLSLRAKPAPEGTPRLPLSAALEPVPQLDDTLQEIADRFGDAERQRVSMELEYAGTADAYISLQDEVTGK